MDGDLIVTLSGDQDICTSEGQQVASAAHRVRGTQIDHQIDRISNGREIKRILSCSCRNGIDSPVILKCECVIAAIADHGVIACIAHDQVVYIVASKSIVV